MDKLPTTCMTALAPLTWGTTYLVATQLLPPGRPLLAAALRALPIGLLLLVGAQQLVVARLHARHAQHRGLLRLSVRRGRAPARRRRGHRRRGDAALGHGPGLARPGQPPHSPHACRRPRRPRRDYPARPARRCPARRPRCPGRSRRLALLGNRYCPDQAVGPARDAPACLHRLAARRRRRPSRPIRTPGRGSSAVARPARSSACHTWGSSRQARHTPYGSAASSGYPPRRSRCWRS